MNQKITKPNVLPDFVIVIHAVYCYCVLAIEFFLNCQIWHFCHSCRKLTSRGFRISKKKITSTGYWTHNTNPTLRFPAPLTTQPPRHLLNRRFMNWTLIISGLIEHDFKRVWKFEAGMDWQIGWVGKGAGILIVGLVLWVQYPVEAIFFLLILKPRDINFVQEWQKCQIWQLRKNSIDSSAM